MRSRPQPFAQRTDVPVMRTRYEIEQLLQKHGADQFLSGSAPGMAMIGFRIKALQIKIQVPMPKGTAKRDEQEERRRWRALLLVIKAKLEAVASGISLLEDEFLAHTVMADGSTVGQWARPQIAAMYKDGNMPPLLPGPKS